MRRIKGVAGGLLALLVLSGSTLSAAQVGWAVSELVRVPHTDFSVTGPEPYSCLSPEEAVQRRSDPVYRFQVWFSRWLETTFDYPLRTQTHDNCARTCAAVPLDASAITELQGYIRDLPDGAFVGPHWPHSGLWARWEDEVDSSEIVDGERLVCATLHNWVHSHDREGYFIVYFER